MAKVQVSPGWRVSPLEVPPAIRSVLVVPSKEPFSRPSQTLGEGAVTATLPDTQVVPAPKVAAKSSVTCASSRLTSPVLVMTTVYSPVILPDDSGVGPVAALLVTVISGFGPKVVLVGAASLVGSPSPSASGVAPSTESSAPTLP